MLVLISGNADKTFGCIESDAYFYIIEIEETKSLS